MKKTERLFRIIDRMRGHKKAVTADTLALEMGVSVRTIYRDMKTLESQAIPIEGEAGVGYMLGSGFDAPPLAFDQDELDALVMGLRLVGREADQILKGAALSALEKIKAVSINPLEPEETALFVPDFNAYEHLHMLSIMRLAIRHGNIMELQYKALSGEITNRSIKPLALVFFPNVHLLAAWCNLRNDFRNFRMDRIISAHDTGGSFLPEKKSLLRLYKQKIREECANGL